MGLGPCILQHPVLTLADINGIILNDDASRAIPFDMANAGCAT